jgi:hypothetical protein
MTWGYSYNETLETAQELAYLGKPKNVILIKIVDFNVGNKNI